jgi:uncharacterized protein (TIGR02285 family)
MANARSGETWCFTGLLKNPEREKLLVYSLPCRLSAPNVVVARAGELDGRMEDGAVSVAGLLDAPDHVLGLVDGFCHGAGLDRLIAAAPGENLFLIHSLKTLDHQLELLLAGRIDWFITFPAQALYRVRESGLDERVALIPIAEPQEYIVGHVACTDNEVGREVVRGVNRVLSRQVPEPAYLDLFLPWVDQGQRARFKERFEALVASRARAWRP